MKSVNLGSPWQSPLATRKGRGCGRGVGSSNLATRHLEVLESDGTDQAGAISLIRVSMRRRMSSRIGRTESIPWPAGSSSFQSSYRLPG